MRRIWIRIAAAAAWIVTAAAVAAAEHAGAKVRVPPDLLDPEETRSVRLYQEVLPTVVTVFTSKEVVAEDSGEENEGVGAGVLISEAGHVLTAAHVVAGADKITVKTHDGRTRPAEVVYSEPGADIALLALLAAEPGLRHARLGDSDRLAVGQVVYVVGAPFGLENSFSMGHISGFREFGRLYDAGIPAEYIQTDAAINAGNSGGPVFDSGGEVIGIASRILTHSGGFEGLGFVVAINTAKQLLALEDHPWMGMDGIFLDRGELGALLNLDLDGGLLLQHVVPGSPAEKAGLRGGSIPAQISGRDLLLGGDLVVEINEQEACHSDCLVDYGRRLAGIHRIPVKFLRAGKTMETVVDVSGARRNFLRDAKKR